jgi:hypothetical protein
MTVRGCSIRCRVPPARTVCASAAPEATPTVHQPKRNPTISEQTAAPKPEVLPLFTRRIEHHKREIARHRDALREILDDLESAIGSADRGIEASDEAVTRLSEYV